MPEPRSLLTVLIAVGRGNAGARELHSGTDEPALAPSPADHRLRIHRHINVTIRQVTHAAVALEAANQEAAASPHFSPDDAPQRSSSCRFEAGVDYDRGGGGRARAIGVTSKETCCALCKARPSCGVATYLAALKQCWFKPVGATRLPPQSNARAVSCIVTEREAVPASVGPASAATGPADESVVVPMSKHACEALTSPPSVGIDGACKVLRKVSIAALPPDSSIPDVRLFCAVYSHQARARQIRAVASTWGKKCDGFMVGGDADDPALAMLNFRSRSNTTETYGTMWQKVRAMWRHIHANHGSSYDFFHIGGDDMFVVVENLKALLRGQSFSSKGPGSGYLGQPIAYFGMRNISLGLRQTYRTYWQGPSDKLRLYNGGGSGYTLSSAVLSKLIEHMNDAQCFPNAMQSPEDLFIGECLRRLGVTPSHGKTYDAQGGSLYNGFGPHFIANFGGRNASAIGHNDRRLGRWWRRQMAMQGLPKRSGADLVSSRSVSFHTVKTAEGMRAVHHILYDPLWRSACCTPPNNALPPST